MAVDAAAGYWSGPWPCEDAGPGRDQIVAGRQAPSGEVQVTSRFAPMATMVVLRDPGEAYLLRHTGGEDAVSFVERIDPVTLEPESRSVDLAAGPVWPGSIAVHANGSVYVVFGAHAHRLDPDLAVEASVRLPRAAPYNGFVVLADGCLVTKDFGGTRPGHVVVDPPPCELIVLEPERLEVVARMVMPEASIARLSADGDHVYVVGDASLHRVRWDGELQLDGSWRYRTMPGQTYGWDCVLVDGSAWFLDDGDGSYGYDGSLRGHGVSTAPLHLVRIDLASGAVTMAEVCGQPGGLVANPPVIDPVRQIALAYDSGNGVVTAFDIADGTLTPRWTRRQDHGGHLLLFSDDGTVLTGDHDRERSADQAVVLDVMTGEERLRVDTGSPVQSVLFPAVGFADDVYLCTFTTVTRLAPVGG